MPTAPTATCPGPAPGALMLVYYPGERGYFAFAADDEGVAAAELPAALASGPGERAAQLLGPFDARIERATRVEILSSGALSREAFHALPWRGRALIEHAPVVYRLDLEPGPAPGPPRSALQLTPPSNLPGAKEEIDAVQVVLRERGISVATRVGDEADLADALGVDLLHYVGHAHAEGWDSALDLGGERRLSARELLIGPTPTLAVLGGCETGLPDPRAHGGGISLAHALLLAGSTAVIATDARILDDLASHMVPTLLAALADGLEPAEALRRAARAHLDRPGWEHFRVYGR